MADQSDAETGKVPEIEKKKKVITKDRKRQIGVITARIIPHLQDIKFYACLVCFCVITL